MFQVIFEIYLLVLIFFNLKIKEKETGLSLFNENRKYKKVLFFIPFLFYKKVKNIPFFDFLARCQKSHSKIFCPPLFSHFLKCENFIKKYVFPLLPHLFKYENINNKKCFSFFLISLNMETSKDLFI